MVNKRLIPHIVYQIATIILFALGLFLGGELSFAVKGINLTIFRICSLLVLVLACFDIPYIIRCLKKKVSYLIIIFVIWIISSLILLPFAKELGKAIKQLLILMNMLFVALLFFVYIDNKKILKILLLSLVGVIFLTNCLSIYEMFSGNYIHFSGSKHLEVYATQRNIFGLYIPINFFDYENNLALYNFLTVFICLLLFALNDKLWIRISAFIIILMNIFINFATNASINEFTLLAIPIIFIILFLMDKKHYKIYLVILAALLTILFGLGIYLLTRLNLNGQGSLNIRAALFINGLTILFKNSYGFGVGLGQVEYYMASYTNTGGIPNVHFFALEMLINMGLPFMVIFCFFYIRKIIHLFKYKNELKPYQNNYLITLICLTYMLLLPLATLGPSSCFGLSYFWLICIVINGVDRIIKEEVEEMENHEE